MYDYASYVHIVSVREKPKIEAKIISKSQNVTTGVGLPVTLKCYVEGDPSQYWVGWLSRNAMIHKGEDHSISTSPSLKSTNGTTHYLTIHSVKVSGKYHCKVYTVQKKVLDQVTHEVLVDNGTALLFLHRYNTVCCYRK